MINICFNKDINKDDYYSKMKKEPHKEKIIIIDSKI